MAFKQKRFSSLGIFVILTFVVIMMEICEISSMGKSGKNAEKKIRTKPNNDEGMNHPLAQPQNLGTAANQSTSHGSGSNSLKIIGTYFLNIFGSQKKFVQNFLFLNFS